MENYSATIEYLSDQPAAIITLFDGSGEWSGGGRIDLPRCPAHLLKSSLYEQGYISASLSAKSKGGRLDRYSEVAK
uniref:Uncharacterized protein n=1 Tax=viral metagenome TaxID=1070528 RepID=A0A6H1Z957_9ZZZZ